MRMVTDRPPRLQKKYDTRQQKQNVKPKGEQIFQHKILPFGHVSIEKQVTGFKVDIPVYGLYLQGEFCAV